MTRRQRIVVGVTSSLLVGSLATFHWMAPAGADPDLPQYKIDALNAAESIHQQDVAGAAVAPKVNTDVAVPCLDDAVASGVVTSIDPMNSDEETTGAFSGGRNLNSMAMAKGSTGAVYEVYAGADDDQPTYGLIVVVRHAKDYCADDPAAGADKYLDSSPRGAFTLVSVVGDQVVVRYSTGLTRNFNFSTGLFTS